MRQLKRFKSKLKTAFAGLKAALSASDNPLLLGYYRSFYQPKDGSVESFLDKYSRSQKDFFVIQVGANDGITHDPIHKFIKRDRWSGILLEPQQYVFENQLAPLYRKHKNIHPVMAALGSEIGKATLYTIGFCHDRWATGIARFDKQLLEGLFEKGKIAKRCKRYGVELPTDNSKWITEQSVDVVTPESLLQQFGVNDVDLLMIDTEGFDAVVVNMFLNSSILPKAIVFESFQIEQSELNDTIDRLKSLEYKTHTIGPNTVAWQSELNDLTPWNEMD